MKKIFRILFFLSYVCTEAMKKQYKHHSPTKFKHIAYHLVPENTKADQTLYKIEEHLEDIEAFVKQGQSLKSFLPQLLTYQNSLGNVKQQISDIVKYHFVQQEIQDYLLACNIKSE